MGDFSMSAFGKIKNLARFVSLIKFYPKAFLGFLALKSKRLPFIQVTHFRVGDNENLKEEARSKQQAIGWAMNDKIIEVSILNKKLAVLRLKEGEELTAQHFYFNRNPKDFRKAIEILSLEGIQFKFYKGMKIFEPGCGAGKHLAFLCDHFGAQAVGMDIYPPAIAVANRINIFSDMTCTVEDTLNSKQLTDYPDGYFDLIYINSHLGHVQHMENFSAYMDTIVRIGKQFLAIERPESKVVEHLQQRGISTVIHDKTLYAGKV